MKVSAVAYCPERQPGWVAQERKLDALLSGLDADLVVLPEYAPMEAALLAAPAAETAHYWRDVAAERGPDWLEQMRHMARLHGIHLLGGSGPWRTERGVVNRSWLVAPSGEAAHQDKLMLTPYERGPLGLVPGEGLGVFDTALGCLGVLICYDAEFPLLARNLVEAGMDVLLVPCCTDTAAGQTRVRQSARARAIEGQIAVVQAPLVGRVRGCEVIDISTGRPAIFGPPDSGFPADGILAQGEADRRGAVTATLDMEALARVRREGQVTNRADWDRPRDAALAAVRIPLA